jgi:glycosyltransferase involved in cell wall biosynthesis
MFKIAIDATPISGQLSGVGFYVANLIEYLSYVETKENFELQIFYQPSFKKWLLGQFELPKSLENSSNLKILPLPVRISNLLLENCSNLLADYCQKYLDNPDLVHGTNYNVYPLQNSLRVINLYDLTFIKYPQFTNSVVKKYLTRVKKCLQWSQGIITISESIKNDIVNFLQIDPKNIYVTHLASRYCYDYLSAIDLEKIEKKIAYNFDIPYILFVSTIEPRKNILGIISAFNYLKTKYKIEHNLILIGQKGWEYKPIFEAIESSPWRQEIHHLNYVSNELVALFYNRADVFVYPSYYEGFGLPVLEAMTLGTPVVTSNISSLPEVAGNAALLVDPQDFVEIGEAVLQIITDENLRQTLIKRGKERANLFSWETTAKKTFEVYKSILD